MITYTVIKEGKVYNARGGDTGKTLIVGDVLTVTSPKTVLIGDKVCYQISAPESGYFLAERVKVVVDSVKPAKPFTLVVEGYQPFSGSLTPL